MLQSPIQHRNQIRPAAWIACALLLASTTATRGQTTNSAGVGADARDLVQTEARLAQRYDQLEVLAGRLAELSRSTQPRRAQLLRELIKRSRERDLPGQFDAISDNLDQQRYSSAIEQQNQLQKDLQNLLELLLQEDRDRQIESQRQRIGRYLQDVKRLIRLQRGVRARTDGADDADRLVQDQQRVGEQTEKLHDLIESTELDDKESDDGKPDDAESDPEPNAESRSGSQDTGREQDDSDSTPSPAEEQPEGADSAPSENGDPQSGQAGQPGTSGQPGEASEAQPQSDQPMDRAAERLREAQQRMEQAQQQLEQAEREGALHEQQEALNELEQAKAELERVLRQLREEERERMLASLESRFRRMLEVQIEVYEETIRLAELPGTTPPHELEIAAGRLSRNERQIVAEADRALLLLREDGTSVAFPEAVEQVRQDMESIAERLLQTKLGVITQGLEEDVIEALEEALAVLQKSLEDLRQQQAQQGQQSASEPGKQQLVDALEELRMIRSLQVRVNNRTESYGSMISGEQAMDAELLTALDALADRQHRIWRATRDLGAGENR